MVIFNKLIRDRVIEILNEKGKRPKYHVADQREYLRKLFEKLDEELTEFRYAKNEEELADVREVLHAIVDAIADFYKLDKAKVRKIQSRKGRTRGRFKKRIILEEAQE